MTFEWHGARGTRVVRRRHGSCARGLRSAHPLRNLQATLQRAHHLVALAQERRQLQPNCCSDLRRGLPLGQAALSPQYNVKPALDRHCQVAQPAGNLLE